MSTLPQHKFDPAPADISHLHVDYHIVNKSNGKLLQLRSEFSVQKRNNSQLDERWQKLSAGPISTLESFRCLFLSFQTGQMNPINPFFLFLFLAQREVSFTEKKFHSHIS